ncbi:hypothetical protein SAMN05421890_4047 [Ensifer adhaerens]|nr:hypothetical protein SAMN05421890_4047 [Ensifer adhaerens]
MQMMLVRRLFVLILMLLCLVSGPLDVSARLVMAPGVPSLAQDRTETKFALPSHRNAVQVLVASRDPAPPSAGGSIVAVLPVSPGLEPFGKSGCQSGAALAATFSRQPDHQRARSPPHSRP